MELLPCPFCGGPARVHYGVDIDEGIALVGCVPCDIDTMDIEHTAIARWNRRTTLAAREDGWRPIESAPKDGVLFLGWVSAERWSHEDGEGSGRAADVSDHDFCRWRDMETGGFYENMMGQIGDTQAITHWQPLPAAPPAQGTGEGCG